MNTEKIADLLLQPVDRVGYYLGRYGISRDFNRHNLIALAMTEKERLEGELKVLELRVKIRRRKLLKARQDLEHSVSEWVNANAPEPVSSRFNRFLAQH